MLEQLRVYLSWILQNIQQFSLFNYTCKKIIFFIAYEYNLFYIVYLNKILTSFTKSNRLLNRCVFCFLKYLERYFVQYTKIVINKDEVKKYFFEKNAAKIDI